jgi:hypothetical protein
MKISRVIPILLYEHGNHWLMDDTAITLSNQFTPAKISHE